MRRYPFPYREFLGLAADLPAGRRSLVVDCRALINRLDPPPLVEGTEHIPPRGPALLAVNHYQRRGMWIVWPSALITLAVADRRGDEPPVHWLVTGGLQLCQHRNRGAELPGARLLLERVAETYQMTALPLSGAGPRAHAVRRWLDWTSAGDVVGIFPEGLRGSSAGLVQPDRNFDGVIRLAGRRGLAILPVAAFEHGERLRVRFGPPLADPLQSGGTVMAGIAALLPEEFRGEFGRAQPATAPAGTAPGG